MSGYEFRFAGVDLVARGSGTLWWPKHEILIVSDLHLGKSERMARRGGQFLPPYETRDTLERLEAEIDQTAVRTIISLGDTFDDDMARGALPKDDRLLLEGLQDRVEWLWISGNHDSQFGEDEYRVDGITFRHIADDGPDISGHYHPKIRIAGEWRATFICHPNHVILPAFGTFTGGLDCSSPALAPYTSNASFILTGKKLVALPAMSGIK